ncbi:hypothetical protein SAMD00019534_036640, partial [Acytostelium subglobosum LB1]|uniref:hypothetical protein n=1 Tax=Acytostelium subglobosum LB1 TaxID=1410327 RepID=UPI00064493B0
MEDTLKIHIDGIRAIDQHCHNILSAPHCFDIPLVQAFTQASVCSDNDKYFKEQSSSTLLYRRTVKELTKLYECGSETELEKRRVDLGLDRISQRCFDEAKLDALIIDDMLSLLHNGVPVPNMPSQWHAQYMSAHKVYRVLRLESILERSLVQAKREQWTYQIWIKHLHRMLRITNRRREESCGDGDNHVEIVGFKSILAYRCGLGIDPQTTEDDVMAEYARLLNTDPALAGVPTSYRVSSKILIVFFLRMALRISATMNPPLPIQIHTGYGDNDLDLEKANPVLLKPLFVEFPTVPIVLLHCSYPYTRQGAYMCWVYPNCYIDIGLAIPMLSQRGMMDTLSALLEVCPMEKILYSSDASQIPEIFYLGSKWARHCLYKLLTECINNEEITLDEAKQFASNIFRGTANKLYHLGLSNSST